MLKNKSMAAQHQNSDSQAHSNQTNQHHSGERGSWSPLPLTFNEALRQLSHTGSVTMTRQ